MNNPHSQNPLLDIKGLRTFFPIRKGLFQRVVGHVRAVDKIDLSIEAGQTLALVGESGCGKTTVGRSILRLIEPQEGEVWFSGKNLLALPASELRLIRRHIQMVFQDPMTSLDPRMRVRDIVAEGIRSFGLASSPSDCIERVVRALQRVQLDPRQMMRYPHEFSGGQRQRIGIARAIAVESKLIICDEAVSALDVSIQAQMLNLLRELQNELGLTYLFITHDLSVVRYLADRVSVMYLGQIVEHGTTERLFSAPAHPYTKGLLAAIPSVDPDKRSVTVRVLGDVPSSSNPPAGCRFHTRCPEVMDRCRREAPDLYSLPDGVCRCFLVENAPGPQPR
jgi:oligopeptide/dipeptide ABC transporter ATP-binding protein